MTRHFGESTIPVPDRVAAASQAGLASSVASDMFDGAAAPISGAAFVASVPTGIPVWPAVLMAGQSPLQFASLQFHDGSDAP
jgi:hypothetical protein